MRRLYETYKPLQEKLESMLQNYGSDDFDNPRIIERIIRKIFWQLYFTLTGSVIDFSEIEDITFVDENLSALEQYAVDVRYLLDKCAEASQKIYMDNEAIAYTGREELIPDKVIYSIIEELSSEIVMFPTEARGGYYECIDACKDCFSDFFERISVEECTTANPELHSLWEKCFKNLLLRYLPASMVDGISEILLENHKNLFFEVVDAKLGIETYVESFCITDALSEILSFESKEKQRDLSDTNEKVKSLIVSGMRERFGAVFRDISDEDVLNCYITCGDEPLLTDLYESNASSAVYMEYVFFKSEAIQYLLSLREKIQTGCSFLSASLREEVKEFYRTFEEEDGIIFPFCSCCKKETFRVFHTEKYYILGVYTSECLGRGFNGSLDSGARLTEPDLSNIVVLQWANRLCSELKKELNINVTEVA